MLSECGPPSRTPLDQQMSDSPPPDQLTENRARVLRQWKAVRKTRKVSELLARQILSDSVAAGLKAGDVLPPESAMIETYDVGRATLREAMRLLEVQGYLRLKVGRGGGPVVNEFENTQYVELSRLHFQLAGATYADVLRARCSLEPLLARLAAQNATDDDRKQFAQLVSSSEHIDVASDEEGYHDVISRAFHLGLGEMAGTRVLSLMSQVLKEVFDSRVWMALWEIEDRAQVRDDHREIAAAVIDGRAGDAETLMAEHMKRFEDRLHRRNPASVREPVAW